MQRSPRRVGAKLEVSESHAAMSDHEKHTIDDGEGIELVLSAAIHLDFGARRMDTPFLVTRTPLQEEAVFRSQVVVHRQPKGIER